MLGPTESQPVLRTITKRKNMIIGTNTLKLIQKVKLIDNSDNIWLCIFFLSWIETLNVTPEIRTGPDITRR